MGVAMKTEQAAALAAAEDRRRGQEPGSGWAAGVKELLDHVAQ
jgi:hypothetical protein